MPIRKIKEPTQHKTEIAKFIPDPKRSFSKLRLPLGSYQHLTLIPTDLGEQFSKSGNEPLVLAGNLATAIDEAFINRIVSLILTEEAQRDIIQILTYNLENNIDAIKNFLENKQYSEFVSHGRQLKLK
jgi:hypothetical protein